MPLTTDQQEFSDADFRVVAKADQSKKFAFDVSSVTTATTRTLTVPDASGTISLTSHTHAFASLTSIPTTVAGYGITDAMPVPTSSTFPVGTLLLCHYTSSIALANGSSTAGTNVDVVAGALTAWGSGAAQAGTWKNVSSITLDNDIAAAKGGYFVRTA